MPHTRPARETSGVSGEVEMNVKSALDRNLNAKHTYNMKKNRTALCG